MFVGEKTYVPYSKDCGGSVCVVVVKKTCENALLPIAVSLVREDKSPVIVITLPGYLSNTDGPISVIYPMFCGSALFVYMSFRSARLKAAAEGGV